MRKVMAWFAAAAAASAVAIYFGEWRYSEDMQAHIEKVNSDLEHSHVAAELSTGLIGSLQTMTDDADVAGEIIATHEHIHTLKDEVLASGIKRAIGDSATVGGAMQAAIAYWESNNIRVAPTTTTVATSQNASTEPISPPAPVSSWSISETTDPVTGEVTRVADDSMGSESLIVRRKGNKLEAYVNTGEFLETMDNVETGISQVAYKFDDGLVIRQGWYLSKDNEGLFYPGDPTPFLAKLAKAKVLAFQFRPADKVPQSIIFDVTEFRPTGFVASLSSPVHHSPLRQRAVAVSSPITDYPECAQRNQSVSMQECDARLRPDAAILPACQKLATEPQGVTQPEAYRLCAVSVPNN